MHSINMGGSAIGTSINVEPEYLEEIAPAISAVAGYRVEKADDLIESTQNLDGFACVSSALKTFAINLSKIANDLRLLSSGPRTGIGEINLPAKQNGSSIMPGKVNPVIPEVVNQVAFLVMGHDLTISAVIEAGQLELNAFEPVLFYQLFESINALTAAVNTLTVSCNGQEESFPLTRRQVIYSASCFGGHDALFGIPAGKPGYFQGDLRKLRITQR